MKCKRLFALLLSLCMIASTFIAVPVSAATENVVDIVVEDASDITWLNGATAADADGIGGRDDVIELSNLANSNGNTAGVKFPDGFAFQAGDTLTYSIDVYSDGTNPDIWIRNHSGNLEPFTTFYNEVTANTWTTITKTITTEELDALITAGTGAGAFMGTSGNFALYFRPRNAKKVYVDNFTVTVARPVIDRATIVEIVVEDASDITWKNGGTAADADGIGGRDGVVELSNLANANGNTAGVKLADNFSFQAGDILTYSVDVYSNGTQPDLWLRNSAGNMEPFTTFYHEVPADTWTTITKTVEYKDFGGTGDWTTAGNFALYFRPRNASKIYIDNFTVTVARELTGKPSIEKVDYVTDEGNGVYKCTTAGIVAKEQSGAWSSQVRLRIIPEVPVSINEDLKVTFDFEAAGILNSIGAPYTEMSVNLRLYDSINGTNQAATIGYIKNAHVAANTGAPVTLEYYIADMENGGGTSSLTEVKSIGVQVDMNGACIGYQTEANDGYFTISNIQVGTGTKEDHEHTYSVWVEDGDNHKKSCSCGDVVTEAHTWNGGIVTVEPTTETEGVKTFTCSACGATYTESIDKLEPEVQRQNVVDITADSASAITWLANNSVTATDANGIGGRDGVVELSGLGNSNTATAGVKLPDGFAFQADDILTYSVDVYSEAAAQPDLWLRNHGSSLNPMAVFYSNEIESGKWITLTRTVTYDELEAIIPTVNSSGTFATAGNYAFYLRPRIGSTIYIDNLTVTVSRPVEERGNIIDLTVNSASDITWKGGVTVTAADVNGIGGRDGVIELAGLGNGNGTTAGVVLADSFAFQEGDILTYSFDVYSDTVTNPDIWVRNHGSSLNPFITLYNQGITTGQWNTVTRDVPYSELAAAGAFDAADKYALYIRPRQPGTVYIDNFKVTVSRKGYEEPAPEVRGNVIDIDAKLDAASELTWIASDAVTATDADGIGGRNDVVKVEGLANGNGNTAGIILPYNFGFAEGDILTYSVDVYSEAAVNPDIWLRNHDGSILTPFKTFYHETIAANTWTTLTKTVTFADLGADYDWTTIGDFALYVRPRSNATVYLDNFKFTVSRLDYTGDPIAPHIHDWDDGVVTKEPTTEAEGERTYTCTICSETKTEKIDKLVEKMVISIGSATAKAGEEVTVSVTLEKNTCMAGLQLDIEYDATALTLVRASNKISSDDYDYTYQKPGNLAANPVRFLWDGENADVNGEILLLTFKVAEDAQAGDYDVKVAGVMATTWVGNETPELAVTTVDGKITATANYTPGDVNGDDEFNTLDIIATRRFITGGWGISIDTVRADVDADSKHTAKDVILMRRAEAGGYNVTLK